MAALQNLEALGSKLEELIGGPALNEAKKLVNDAKADLAKADKVVSKDASEAVADAKKADAKIVAEAKAKALAEVVKASPEIKAAVQHAVNLLENALLAQLV